MNKIQAGISITALVIAIVHSIWPGVTIDSITVAMVVVSIIPWLAPLMKSVELPGGAKIEFREFEKAQEKAEKVGLLSKEVETRQIPDHTFLMVAEEDPILALAGLRIEVEKRLRTIADRQGIPTQHKGVGQLLRLLSENNLLSNEERSVLMDMVDLLNGAVHGKDVDDRTAQWALDVGPRILKGLDERLQL